MKPMSEAEAENKNGTEKDTNSRIYELGYLLVPTVPGEDVPAVFGNLKELVSSLGGVVISDEMPKMMPLAYAMVKITANVCNKFKTAYFGWTKFAMDSDKVSELKKKLDLNPNFIRFLIIKTVKENTIAAKRFVRGEMRRRPRADKNSESGTTVPINKDEIDKEIDALVAT